MFKEQLMNHHIFSSILKEKKKAPIRISRCYQYLALIPELYSVMQSDGNSFCGDVASSSFNKINQDEDTFSDLYIIKYVCIIIMMILIPYNI